MSGGKGKGKGKGKTASQDGGSKSQSHSAKAGLIFPVGRIKRFLKKSSQSKARVGAKG